MKRGSRSLILFLCLSLVLIALFSSLSVSAAEEKDSLARTVDEVNALDRTLTDIEYSKALKSILDNTRMFDHYSDANKKNASINLLNAVRDEIQPYVDEINRLQRGFLSDDATEENKAALRDLTLEGLYMGTLAWIYHSGTEDAIKSTVLSVTVEEEGTSLPTTAQMTLSDYYAYLRDTAIKGKSDTYFAKTEPSSVYTYFTRLLRAIYEARLLSLMPDDSVTGAKGQNILSVLEQSIRDIKSCSYTPGVLAETKNGTQLSDGEDAYPFRQICRRAEVLIRATSLYELLCPQKAFGDSAATRSLITDMQGAIHDSEINACLEAAFDGLLSDLQGEDTADNQYTYAYLGTLRAALSDAFDQANAARELIDTDALIEGAFQRYEFKAAKAAAKDRLNRTLSSLLGNEGRYPASSEERARLESLIHSAVAIVDGCTTLEEISLEASRGETQATLYDRYLHATEQIRDYTSDSADLAAQLTQDYNRAKSAVAASDTEKDIGEKTSASQDTFDKLVASAEARAYLEQHKALFDKVIKDGFPVVNSLSAEDRAAAEAAIDATAEGTMSALAREKLLTELDALGTAYRYLIKETVISTLENPALTNKNDPLRTELAYAKGILSDRISALDTSYHQLPTLKEALLGCLSEATEIRRIADYADTELRASPLFSTFDDALTDRIYSSYVSTVQSILARDRTDSPKTLCDRGILSLSRMYTEEALNRKTAEAASVLDSLSFLGKSDKETRKQALDSLKQSTLFAMENAASPQEVAALFDDASSSLDALSDKARADNLTLAKAQAVAALGDRETAIKNTVLGYTYLPEATKGELIDALTEAAKSGRTAINQAADTDAVASTKQSGEAALDAIAQEADRLETERCLESVKDTLSGVLEKRDEYSEEQFDKIEELIAGAEDRLTDASSREEYQNTLDDTLTRIDRIPNRLEEAKTSAKDRLDAVWGAVLSNKEGYREEDFASATEHYQAAISAIQALTALSDSDTVSALADQAIGQISAIRPSAIYTPDKELHPSNTPSSDYLPWDGYYGSITAEGGLPYNGVLTVNRIGRDSVGAVSKQIIEAAKNGRIVDRNGSPISEHLSKLIKKSHVTTGLDITFTPVEDGTVYTVSVLLPDGTDLSHLLGIVFLREDGSAEYYELSAEGLLIRAELHHFSNYYIICSDVVNLLPLILILALILASEIVLLAILYLRRLRREKKAVLLSLTALAQPYFPENGWMTVTLLGVAILLLGGWIAALLLSERTALHKRCKPEPEEDAPRMTDGETVEETETVPALPEAEPTPALPEAEPTPVLPEPPTVLALPEPERELSLPEPAPIHALPEAVIYPALPEPEEEPIALYIEPEKPVDLYDDPEEYTGRGRGEINLDTLSMHFEVGETVTLNSMKRARLLSSRIGHVTVLARGENIKPLRVVAQDFSAAAKRKLEKAGGCAIVTPKSGERSKQRR